MQPYAGGFNSGAFSADFELVERGELQQVAVIELDVSVVGKEQQLNLPMACNAFSIVTGVLDENGVVQRSSVTAVVGLRFNDRNQKPLVFSLIAGNQDLKSFVGTIVKVYARVAVADAANTRVYFVGLLASGVSSVVSASGYNPPAGRQQKETPPGPA